MHRSIAAGLLLLVAILGGCGDTDNSSSADVSSERSLEETKRHLATEETAATFSSNVWIESEDEQEDGSSARQRIELDELVAANDFEALEGFEGLAGACEVDYQRDAFIPGKLVVENTTRRFPIEITSGVFVGIRSTLAGEDPYPELPVIDIAQGFTAGPSCEVASATGNASVAGVDFTIDSGGTDRQNFLIVIHDYYSPANPSGRKEDLADLRAGIYSPVPLFTDWEQTCVSASSPLDGETVRLDGGPITDRQFEPSELPSC